MGKKGEALRAAKAKQTVYTFTREQLDARDRQLLVTYRTRVKKETDAYIAGEKKRIWEEIEKEWAERERLFHDNDGTGGILTVVGLLEAVSCRILIEHFGWPPIRRVTRRSRTIRFCDLMVDEVNRIMQDVNVDIRRYNREVYEKYEIRFEAKEAEG